MLCCALLWLYIDWFSHIHQTYFTGTGAIVTLGQSNDCPSASKAILTNMDKYFMWIHYERLHNHNKAKHNKTVCIFLGIYCRWYYDKIIFVQTKQWPTTRTLTAGVKELVHHSHIHVLLCDLIIRVLFTVRSFKLLSVLCITIGFFFRMICVIYQMEQCWLSFGHMDINLSMFVQGYVFRMSVKLLSCCLVQTYKSNARPVWKTNIDSCACHQPIYFSSSTLYLCIMKQIFARSHVLYFGCPFIPYMSK